jgi:hypothetical protein
MHPEGARNHGADPFQLLPTRSGAGRIALAVPHARVIPVFVLGLGNRISAEVARNLLDWKHHPVRVAFGPEVDLADLRAASGPAAVRTASERFRSAIEALAEGVRLESQAPSASVAHG